jgi:RES domain-containing protein
VKLWRIATETRKYRATDLTGEGSAINPGRWNESGDAVLYASSSIALAVLETAAHINPNGLPMNRYLISLEVPNAVWAAREELDAVPLPATWSAIPAGTTSAAVGSQWIKSRRSAILLAQSVIVPEERVALLNPAHADAAKVKAVVVRRFEYDSLFRL